MSRLIILALNIPANLRDLSSPGMSPGSVEMTEGENFVIVNS
ncbi:MAG: hypothetical protein UT48_C0028G0004 [Parcubacteria group bacterium GW2011_GWE2_39_37]|uniref:Uncharacterized protein n=1 Tax=Candidatus Falkowbacteria bacterium GW2011_GWF2_39_8 TaxID=1618642 RepID=A0A0G0Q702_9BACT|nr:MAG: hypothetical protein UT48_C0028G0004 [Parcubacteria group bacterium GW2011_GWE2_39_37]KKR33091.1 MAG: hypothetical protein UT64_C0015G0003 [Candidatus Falkowbacteria bacterium GW2011_GWF2_39_8]